MQALKHVRGLFLVFHELRRLPEYVGSLFSNARHIDTNFNSEALAMIFDKLTDRANAQEAVAMAAGLTRVHVVAELAGTRESHDEAQPAIGTLAGLRVRWGHLRPRPPPSCSSTQGGRQA